MKEAILSILLSLPPAAWPEKNVEDYAERSSRMKVVSYAIEEASSYNKWPGTKQELAALLITQAFYESGFARGVHSGKFLGDCANFRKQKNCTSISLWQIKNTSYFVTDWESLAGLDDESTNNAALTAAKILSSKKSMCGRRSDWPIYTISAYVTGNCRIWKKARERAVFMSYILYKLQEKK